MRLALFLVVVLGAVFSWWVVTSGECVVLEPRGGFSLAGCAPVH